MDQEQKIKQYFKPTLGYRKYLDSNKKSEISNLTLLKSNDKSSDVIKLNDNIAYASSSNTADISDNMDMNSSKNSTFDNSNLNFHNLKSSTLIDQNQPSNTKFRKSSLLRAKKLVSCVLKNQTKNDEGHKKVVHSRDIRNIMALRKRLFNEDFENSTDPKMDSNLHSENNTGIEIVSSASNRYNQLIQQLPTIPAFKRFKHLIDDRNHVSNKQNVKYPYETKFTLPQAYEKLLSFYKSADTVLYMLQQRKEGCTFSRLKKLVEALTKKTFERSDLAKILFLRPNDFKVYLNENPDGMTKLIHEKQDKTNMLLMVSPDYSEALQKFSVSTSPISSAKHSELSQVELSPIKVSKLISNHFSPTKKPIIYNPLSSFSLIKSPYKDTNSYITPSKSCCPSPINQQFSVVRPSHLVWRKDQLYSTLMRRTHDQHKNFLNQIGICDIDYSQLKQWHSKFNLDDVEPIPEATLPDDFRYKITITAKDILYDTEIKLNSVVRDAIQDTVAQRESHLSLLGSSLNKVDYNSSSDVSCLTPVCQKVLKSIPSNIIEKIKEKERKTEKIKMLIKNDEDENKNMLQKLPEILKLMFNYLRSERKTCMILSKVVEKMTQCTQIKMSNELMEKHIILLSNVVPDLVSLPIVGNSRFVRIVQIRCSLGDALNIIKEKISNL